MPSPSNEQTVRMHKNSGPASAMYVWVDSVFYVAINSAYFSYGQFGWSGVCSVERTLFPRYTLLQPRIIGISVLSIRRFQLFQNGDFPSRNSAEDSQRLRHVIAQLSPIIFRSWWNKAIKWICPGNGSPTHPLFCPHSICPPTPLHFHKEIQLHANTLKIGIYRTPFFCRLHSRRPSGADSSPWPGGILRDGILMKNNISVEGRLGNRPKEKKEAGIQIWYCAESRWWKQMKITVIINLLNGARVGSGNLGAVCQLRDSADNNTGGKKQHYSVIIYPICQCWKDRNRFLFEFLPHFLVKDCSYSS